MVGEHLVSLKWTITGTNVLTSTMFKITFTCDNTLTPSVVIGSTAPTLAFTHDTLSSNPTIVQMSTWALDVAEPCFTITDLSIFDITNLVDSTTHFGAYDAVNFMLPLVGNAGLSGQTIDYLLQISVLDETVNSVMITIEGFSVDWSTACDPATVPSLNYGTFAGTTSFYPDPATNTDLVVQLTTFTVDPPMPCFQYIGFAALDTTNGNIDESALFSFDPSTAMLTMIGSLTVNQSTQYYNVMVQIGDGAGTWVRDV